MTGFELADEEDLPGWGGPLVVVVGGCGGEVVGKDGYLVDSLYFW